MKGSRWKVSWEQKGMLPNVRGVMPALLGISASMAQAEWIKVARANLRTSRQEYISGIQAPEIKGKTATLKLDGWLPNALESGLKAFDMKPGFLRSPKAKGTKGNKYFTVPFQLRAPGSTGGSATVMPKSIYGLVSSLKFGQSLNLPKKYEGYGLRSKLSQDIKKWGNYTWKASPFCLHPDTKILTWDLRWVSIGSCKEGDFIVGVTNNSSFRRGRTIEKSIINEIETVELQAFKIFLKDGRTLISSGDHLWLGNSWNSKSKYVNKWIFTKDLKVGMSLRGLVSSTWNTDKSYESGYLSGFLDGEGSVHIKNNMVSFHQKSDMITEKVINFLRNGGFSPYIYKEKTNIWCVGLTDLESCLRLLGSVRPQRLLDKMTQIMRGKFLPDHQRVDIVHIERLTTMELIGIQTSTETLIAEGIVSHNSGVTKVRRFPGELRSSAAGKMAQYKTFRRVSKKSAPGSWIHPGFKARDLMEKAVAAWEPQVSNMIAQVLST